MDKNLIELYRELGYTGPLPGDTGAGIKSIEDATLDDMDELPPLDLKGLEEMEKLFKNDRKTFRKRMKGLNERKLTDKYCSDILKQARHALTHPDECRSRLKAQREEKRVAMGDDLPWPEGTPRYHDIKVEPERTKFEPDADALRWVINSGPHLIFEKLGLCSKKIFRWHDDVDSNYVYTMKDPAGNAFEAGRSVKIGLFADFGTGEYHSRYIARHMETQFELDYAIHLGDVYYAGSSSQFERYMWNPLLNLMQKTRTFWMAGNHEKYSCYKPYYKFMDKKAGLTKEGLDPKLQEQEGSYFCIRSDKFQIIGLDTAFFKNGRYKKKKLRNWLRDRLQEAANDSRQRITILLTPNQPYDLGGGKRRLLNDLAKFVDKKQINLWFWGNTHQCALYNKAPHAPFIGSCIGHGGHPVDRKKSISGKERADNGKGFVSTMWVDTSPKFPEKTFGKLREELGNHGFCIMELQNDQIVLDYYDWFMVNHNRVTLPLDTLT
ncbi:MAG: hypothetical protein GY940_10805 [bacterium]|nr:hypothetical protein [bacterium]